MWKPLKNIVFSQKPFVVFTHFGNIRDS